MNTILVPVDFSDCSEYAMQTAALMAKRHEAEILAVHMLEISEAMINKPDALYKEEAIYFLELAKSKLQELLKKNYLKGIRTTPIIKHYKIFKELNEIADKHGADLIIMGSHGVSGAKEVLFGSNAEKVVRFSKIPVMVVKKQNTLVKFDIAVFACDFSHENINSYLRARLIFKKMGTKFYLLYVNLPGENFKTTNEMEIRVEKFLKAADNNLKSLADVRYINDLTIEAGIHNFANKVGADFIIIPTHGRKGLAHFFSGSITEDVANHSPIPVLSLRI